MGRKTLVAGVLGAAVLLWVRTSDGQVFPTPTAGSGIVAVDIRNEVNTAAAQRGDWRVSVANSPDVRVANMPPVALAPLPFLRAGMNVAVTWPQGEIQRFRIAEVIGGGWVRTDSQARGLWVNLSAARSVEETN